MKDCQFKSDRLVDFSKKKGERMKFTGYTKASLRNIRTKLVHLKRYGLITVEQFDKAISLVEKRGYVKNKSYVKKCDTSVEADAFEKELESQYDFVLCVCQPLTVKGNGTYEWEVR